MALKLIDSIYVKRITDRDEFGEAVLDNEERVSVRWNDEIKHYVSDEGLTLASNAIIYFDKTIDLLKVGDMVKLLEGDEYQPIRAVTTSRNGSGTKTIYSAYLTPNVR